MIGARAVTFQTALSDVFGSRFFKGEDFALFTTTVNVLRAGTVTGFATTGFGPVFGLQKIVPVAGLLKIVKDILVAGLAGIGPYVWRRGRLLSRFVGRTWRLFL
jgi:hypothetical protein